MPEEKVKRKAVYVQRPRDYEMSSCPQCGNEDPDWSEYQKHLWCEHCQIDFIPKCAGIFDGPIPVEGAKLMGIDLRMIDLETGKIIPVPGEEA
jgi:hypothetical protein